MKAETLWKDLKTFIELIRVKNASIAFLGVLVGALLSPYPAPAAIIILAGLSAAAILAGGNAINDYFDVEIDRVNKPKRPLPSGRITSSDTIMTSLTLFLIGLGIAKFIGTYCLTIAALNTLLLIIYAKYSKKMLLTSNLTVSYLVASIFIYGAAVTITTPDVDAGRFTLTYILTACSFLMTLSREITKDIEDIEGDRKKYALTLPIVYGAGNAKSAAIIIGITAIAASAIPIINQQTNFNTAIYTPVIAIADLIFLTALTMNPTPSQKTMIIGMVTSLIAFTLGINIKI
ncbi:MAG: UbiA family prenyltransferase [Candidatus Altiarchaeota archaeon]|nr:UbiA family prenyltransferase [Candidatus Altiarchaeota archaeon]